MPEHPMPGTGAWPLLYTCNDTGNTGLQSWEFMRSNFRAVACPMGQNHRWGIIQSSCLCVGLPGAIEEARLRATAAFLSGGQIDISDTLTTLPEDRWSVLQATLPPLGLTARPVDLFDPIYHLKASDYEALCRGLPTPIEQREHPPGSVWHLRVSREWDTWDLVACYAFDQGPGSDRPELTNYTIPLTRVGLESEGSYWAHEFWGGQLLGAVTGWRTNPNGYAHPGDWQDLLTPGPPGALSLSFTGPGVKLLALRRARPHPWVVGSTFHQSCGAELVAVAWDPDGGILSGRLRRPAGECGALFITGAGWTAVAAEVSGRPSRSDGRVPIQSAHGSWRIPILTSVAETVWSVQFRESANIQPELHIPADRPRRYDAPHPRPLHPHGKDPYLNGTLVTAFVRGLQGDHPRYWQTASLLKHFLANSNEDERVRSSSDFDQRLLREYYSVPFHMGIVEGGARAYMAANNAYNGIPCTVHPILKDITETSGARMASSAPMQALLPCS